MGRIAEVLDEEPFIANPAGDLAIAAPADGSIEFRDVSFKYRADAAEDVLEHIDLRIESGSTVGILGGTGIGQELACAADCAACTTLPRAPCLWADVTCVTTTSRPYATPWALCCKRTCCLRAPCARICSGAIRRRRTRSSSRLAARRAWTSSLIASAGWTAELAKAGAGVSGGQKQRLCIARTLLKHPRVLIFDDSTSAVDMATDAKIREHIARISDTTVLIIAQRIASVMDADRIVVLDDGRVHGVGTHEELLAGDNIYQEIYASQMEFARNAEAGDGSDDGCASDPFSSVACGSPLEGGERHA